MLHSLVALAAAFVAAVSGTPAPVDAGTGFPVVQLGSVAAHPNVTLGSGGPHIDTAQATFPAVLYLCRTANCGSCTAVDLSVVTHGICWASGFAFASVIISQPSNVGLPFGVYVGATCESLPQIPAVDTCYNAVGGPFFDYEIWP